MHFELFGFHGSSPEVEGYKRNRRAAFELFDY
jgi:hypothetical protein